MISTYAGIARARRPSPVDEPGVLTVERRQHAAAVAPGVEVETRGREHGGQGLVATHAQQRPRYIDGLRSDVAGSVSPTPAGPIQQHRSFHSGREVHDDSEVLVDQVVLAAEGPPSGRL
jgi:hypothetical protein